MEGRLLRIGEVAGRAGVNVQTLRYYERRGLLRTPARTASGYREYPTETVSLVRFVKRAQALGFTLEEIQELASLRDARARKRSEVRALADAKVRDIDKRVSLLLGMRHALTSLIESCACRNGQPTCPILDTLDDGATLATLDVSKDPARNRDSR